MPLPLRLRGSRTGLNPPPPSLLRRAYYCAAPMGTWNPGMANWLAQASTRVRMLAISVLPSRPFSQQWEPYVRPGQRREQ